MTSLTKRCLMVYVALLFCLALVGAQNQELYRTQASLIDQKLELQTQLTDLRVTASRVNGALAVREWAYARGMVSAPQVEDVKKVMPSPAPEVIPSPEQRLEVRTLWR